MKWWVSPSPSGWCCFLLLSAIGCCCFALLSRLVWCCFFPSSSSFLVLLAFLAPSCGVVLFFPTSFLGGAAFSLLLLCGGGGAFSPSLLLGGAAGPPSFGGAASASLEWCSRSPSKIKLNCVPKSDRRKKAPPPTREEYGKHHHPKERRERAAQTCRRGRGEGKAAAPTCLPGTKRAKKKHLSGKRCCCPDVGQFGSIWPVFRVTFFPKMFSTCVLNIHERDQLKTA